MIVSRAETYIQYGHLPKLIANEVIVNFKESIRWKQNCTVLDVGCGPGNVTHDVLLPNLPTTLHKLVGVDKCPDFIEFAKKNYEKDSIVYFKVMNIVNDEVSAELHHYFDYIVSFLCLHQFNDHKTAFDNFKKMLKPEGEILLCFPITTSAFDMYKRLASQDKWKSHLDNWEEYCSPYKNSTNFTQEIKQFLSATGFQIASLEFKEKTFKYFCKDFLYAHRVLTSIPLPNDLMDEFVADSLQILKHLNRIKLDKYNEEYFDFNYRLAVIHLVKA